MQQFQRATCGRGSMGAQIRTLGYPVLGRQFTPRRAAKETYGTINVPVRIGTLSIGPKDFVLADANGIVSIPRTSAREALQLASELCERNVRLRSKSSRAAQYSTFSTWSGTSQPNIDQPGGATNQYSEIALTKATLGLAEFFSSFARSVLHHDGATLCPARHLMPPETHAESPSALGSLIPPTSTMNQALPRLRNPFNVVPGETVAVVLRHRTPCRWRSIWIRECLPLRSLFWPLALMPPVVQCETTGLTKEVRDLMRQGL